MISVIITAYKEPKTIDKAINSIKAQINFKDEIIVTAPDKETLSVVRKIKDKRIKILQDNGQGKPAALNLAAKKAKGDILILTDGDVFVGNESIKFLIDPFKNKNIGAVTGRPIPINSKNDQYGYWAHLLTEVAHERRKRALRLGKRLFGSGYLFGIRKDLLPHLDSDLLSEDGYISNEVYKRGYKIDYSEKAQVFVKYPDNFKDWILQKRRSTGGYNQIKRISNVEIRSFRKELFGSFQLIKYVSDFNHVIWLSKLFLARVYLWGRIFWDLDTKKKKREELWKRVESTK